MRFNLQNFQSFKRIKFEVEMQLEDCVSTPNICTAGFWNGTYLLHPKFFILVCYTLCFTPYPFHPWCFISLISSLVFSSPGYHPIPFPTQLAKIPFHPNLFIPIKAIYYFILAFFILKIERMTCTGWKRRVKSVNMKLIRWKT